MVSAAPVTFQPSGGTCTIAASQSGNSSYAAAPTVSQSFTVNALSPSTYQISGYVLLGGYGPSAGSAVPVTGGITVTLSSQSGALISTTMTNTSTGSYSFTVTPGTYTIAVSSPGSFYTLSSPQSFTISGSSVTTANFTATFTSGGSLSPSSPNKEYIFLNGSIVAVEHPH